MKIDKLIAISVCLLAYTSYAQNETDAFKFSESMIGGTARSQGAGGAFGAVGADFGSTLINPAGLGLYRRNEVVFGTGLTNYRSSATYFSNTLDDSRTNFNLPTWGFVATKVFNDMGQDVKTGLVSISFAAGMNRVNSYQQNIRFAGTNTQNSLLDYFKYSATGLNANDILNNFSSNQNNYANIPGAAAYNYFLLDTLNNANNYKALTDGVSNYRLQQQYQTTVRGGANEYNISGGANLSNIVYLGAGLVIKHVYSETDVLLTENAQGTVPTYNSSSLQQDIDQRGTGVGGRFGIIVRPLDFLKLGFGVQTPTRLNMRDDYRFIVTSNNSVPGNSQPNVNNVFNPNRFDFFEYQIINPGRLTGSAAFTLSKVGFVSVDFETVDYSNMRLQSSTDFFTQANTAIKTNFVRANNLRLGAEVKIAEFYRLRGGYAIYGNPYKNDGGEDLNRYALTGGVGFLIDRIFIDFAVVNTFGKQFISPYTTGDMNKPNPTALNNYNIYNFVLSGGIRF